MTRTGRLSWPWYLAPSVAGFVGGGCAALWFMIWAGLGKAIPIYLLIAVAFLGLTNFVVLPIVCRYVRRGAVRPALVPAAGAASGVLYPVLFGLASGWASFPSMFSLVWGIAAACLGFACSLLFYPLARRDWPGRKAPISS